MRDLKEIINNDVSLALAEDLGLNGIDVTGELIPKTQKSCAKVLTRQPMVLAGKDWFNETMLQLDKAAVIEWFYNDGDSVPENQILCRINANSRALLASERVALNFLQMLSAIATKTKQYVAKIHSNTKLLDTRKTLPNLRAAQKYAVTCGGGINHRFGLYDAFLIKENHIKACGSISKAINEARKQSQELLVEVEVENLLELKEALIAGADRIMLDNFPIDKIIKAMAIKGTSKAALEASGNVSLATIEALSNTGVDFISVGDLTKSVEAIDLSLLVEEVFND